VHRVDVDQHGADVTAPWQVVHRVEQHFFEDGAQPPCPGTAQQRLVGDPLECLTREVELDIFSGMPNPTWILTDAEADTFVKLLQSPLSGLPPGLAAEPDTGEEALAEFGGAAQAIAAEARLLAHPVSFEVVSSGKAEGIEDRTTMAPLAARRLADMADLAARVISLELLVAAQAIGLRRPARLGEGTGRALRLVRELAGFTARGQAPPADLEPLVDAVRAGSFARAGLPGR